MNNLFGADTSTLKSLFKKMFEIEFDVKQTLEFVLQDMEFESERDGALIKLRALFQIEKASFPEIYSYILENEKGRKRKDGEINRNLRGAIIKSISDILSIEQNLQLAFNDCFLLRSVAETIGVENFSPEQIKNLADIIKGVDVTKLKKFKNDSFFGCFTQPVSRLINWVDLLEKTSLDNCIEICTYIDRGEDDWIIWENLVNAIWEKLTKEDQDILIYKVNNSCTQKLVLLHRELNNDEIVAICRKWKNYQFWNIAVDKLNWSSISQKDREEIIKEARENDPCFSENVANKLSDSKKTNRSKISLAGEYNSWSFLENLLKNKTYKFETLLRLPTTMENKPTGLLIVGYNDLTNEQFDELVKLDFLCWDQEAIDWSKTALMCSHAISMCQNRINFSYLIEKIEEQKPCADDMVKILKNIHPKIKDELHIMISLSDKIPYEQYTLEEIIKTYEIFVFPRMLDDALTAIAKNTEKQEEEKKKNKLHKRPVTRRGVFLFK